MAAINPAENPSVIERRDESKQKLLEALKEMPVITVACKRSGIDNSTYYRWRQEDKEFMRQSRDAFDRGIEFVNDMSETQVIALIKEKKMPAIALWLKHHHARYGSKNQAYVPITAREDLTPEENQIVIEALALASGKAARKKKPTNHDGIHNAGIH
jgi:hypothetical protein